MVRTSYQFLNNEMNTTLWFALSTVYVYNQAASKIVNLKNLLLFTANYQIYTQCCHSLVKCVCKLRRWGSCSSTSHWFEFTLKNETCYSNVKVSLNFPGLWNQKVTLYRDQSWSSGHHVLCEMHFPMMLNNSVKSDWNPQTVKMLQPMHYPTGSNRQCNSHASFFRA